MVSIIVSIYNVENYLDRCIQSLIEQTYQNIEILLIDDGSTDASGMVCDQWHKKDNRIKVYHKENGGPSSARNYGIDHCNGSYIMFVDGDDYVKKNYVDCLYHEITQKQEDMVICNYEYVTETGNRYKSDNYTYYQSTKILNGMQMLKLFEDRRYKTFFDVVWNKIYRRDLFHEIRFPEGITLVEDIYILPKLYCLCNKISVVPEQLYLYVFHKDSLSRKHMAKDEEYLLRWTMMEERKVFYKNLGNKELQLTHLIHMFSLAKKYDGNLCGTLQKEFRVTYFDRHCIHVALNKRLKYLLAAFSLPLYQWIVNRKS